MKRDWEIIVNNLSDAVSSWGRGIILVLLIQSTVRAENEFSWKDASNNWRNLSDLREILREHQQWIESAERSGTRADLSGAGLSEANLTKANLRRADLTGANLHGANLSHADLSHANLSGTDLSDADLSGTGLSDADLSHADLAGAGMSGANLTRANLSGALVSANLTGAYLTGANLTNALVAANLSGADLTGANLTNANMPSVDLRRARLQRTDLSGALVLGANVDGAIFEPQSLPLLRGIATARHLERLTYEGNPATIFQLRKQFEDGGLREQERKITYALKRREAELSWEGTSRELPGPKTKTRPILWSSDSILANFASFILNKVFFDWTCQYGMSPGRPLIFGVVLWCLCSLLYFACIHTHGEAGLYRIYGRTIPEDPSTHQRLDRISPVRAAHARWGRRLFQFFRREFLLLRTSMFFSLMSAFNIGFRDIDFGRWLRLLTRQEFDIKAVGWARVVAGWQSLISVYLIALWVLTYFGRPFD